MSLTIAPLPTLPGPHWTYAQALETEAALHQHMAEHGHSDEAVLELAQTLTQRCAYRTAVGILERVIVSNPGLEHSMLGLNAQLLCLGAALHGGLNVAAERRIAAIAEGDWKLTSGTAAMLVRQIRGTGLQPECRAILERCATFLAPDSSEAEVVDVLVREYEEASAIARRVRLVSLGAGCHPWLHLNRFMLRRVDAVDTLMPFNLCATAEFGLVAALESRLAGFFDAAQYDRTTMTRGIPVARIRPYAMLLCHDTDDEYLAHDMAELREVCAQRARTFLGHAVAGPRVLVRVDGTCSDLHRLEASVAGLMQDDEYRLLLVTTQAGDPPDLPRPRLSTTHVVHVPAPWDGYNWAVEEGTPEGHRYDLRMRRAVLDVMRELA